MFGKKKGRSNEKIYPIYLRVTFSLINTSISEEETQTILGHMGLYKCCDIEASNSNTNSSRSNICANSNISFCCFYYQELS